MKIDRVGVILYTFDYLKCVDFYKNVLELPVLFEKENLTCFEFGAAYLMVELDDERTERTVEKEQLKTCLRFNVSNIGELTQKLISKGLVVNYQEHDWGIVAKFFDPDGNLCALKDSKTFEKQLV